MIKETVKYKGKIDVAFKKGKTTVKKSTHNDGLPDMAYLFAKAVVGSMDYTTDIPRLLDIGYIVPSTESSVNVGDSGVWMSILNNPVAIGGRQYKFDTDLKNWVGILTTTVHANDLNSALLPNVKENVSLGNYALQIRLCSYKKQNRKYFAEVAIGEDFITNLTEATAVIITWYTELLYNEPDTSNIVSGDVEENE